MDEEKTIYEAFKKIAFDEEEKTSDRLHALIEMMEYAGKPGSEKKITAFDGALKIFLDAIGEKPKKKKGTAKKADS